MVSGKQPCNCKPGCTKPLAERTRRHHRQLLREKDALLPNPALPIPPQLEPLLAAVPERDSYSPPRELAHTSDAPYLDSPSDATAYRADNGSESFQEVLLATNGEDDALQEQAPSKDMITDDNAAAEVSDTESERSEGSVDT
ncbi:hypothetical protein FRB90_000460 [Tulasnella sp. 427]|nr:hypothetical protein FRB90_000460 [Tulasnella sp. 427]